jgi:hypothetical protein
MEDPGVGLLLALIIFTPEALIPDKDGSFHAELTKLALFPAEGDPEILFPADILPPPLGAIQPLTIEVGEHDVQDTG